MMAVWLNDPELIAYDKVRDSKWVEYQNKMKKEEAKKRVGGEKR